MPKQPDFNWTKDRVDWLRMAMATPDPRSGKAPGYRALAKMASERYGQSVSWNQVRHAIIRYIEAGKEAADAPEGASPDVALLMTRLSAAERSLEQEKDKNEIICAAIEQTVSSLPTLEPLPPIERPKGEDPHVAMIDISDAHVGEKVDPVLTGGLSEYNFDLFKTRGERLRRGVARVVDIHRRVYPVDVLYVNFLGDIVTGEAIYRGQAFQIDMPLLMQVFEGGYWFANLLREFSRDFREVHVRCVAGNHGRGYERGANHPRTNWDIGAYMLLKTLLAEHKNIDFELSETSFLTYHVPGHERFRHALIHGDQARSWMGMPWYGLERAGAKMQSMLGMTLDYIHAGHHHNEAEWPTNRVEFLINGSWVGGSDLSVNKLFRTSRPTQNLFFLHGRRGVVASYRIHLDDWSEMHPDSKGIYRPGAKRGGPPTERRPAPSRARRAK